MSTTFPDLSKTNFPDSIDPNRLFVDVNLTNKPYVDLFYTKYNANDFAGAAQVMVDHPELANIIINAATMQTIYDMIIAGQRFYKSDVQDKIGTIVKYKGDYSATAKYDLFNLVAYNGKTYMCINENTPVGTSPVSTGYFIAQTIQGASGTGLSPRPSWISSEAYYQYDCVPYDSKLWVALRNNTGKIPSSNPDDWTTILTVPKQIIFSVASPDGQVADDIWIEIDSVSNKVTLHRKNSDGTYSEIDPKTLASNVYMASGTDAETAINSAANSAVWSNISEKPPTYPSAWSDVSGKPTTFSPSSHNHNVSDINAGVLPVIRGGTGVAALNLVTVGKATSLETPRNINGIPFNGTADITVTAAGYSCNGLTFEVSAAEPSSVIENKITFVYG